MKVSNRELLEFAAVAINLKGLIWSDQLDALVKLKDADYIIWNPLKDDGDAFRLSNELNLNVFHAASSAYAMPSNDDGNLEVKIRYCDAGDDKIAAARLAIVIVAAAIGKEMS